MSDVYLIGALDSSIAKIGTSCDVDVRIGALQSGSPVRLHILATVPGSTPLETALHRHFQALRIHGEWFDFGSRDRVAAFRNAVAETGPSDATVTVHHPAANLQPGRPRTPEEVRQQLAAEIRDWVADGEAYFRRFRQY